MAPLGVLVAILAGALLVAGREAAGGAFYFWNIVTNEVTWNDPGHVPFVAEESGQRFYVNADGESTWERPPDPSGWREFVDETEKLPYFHNMHTGDVTWERPKELGWQRVRADEKGL